MEKKLHLESNCERIVASKTLKNRKNVKKEKNILHLAVENRSFVDYLRIDLQTDNPEGLPV